MKSRFIIHSISAILIVLFSSCNSSEVDDTSVYWNSNTLTRLQLRGPVKQVLSNSGKQTITFNSDGFITSDVYVESDNSYTTTTTYNYQANRLISIVEASTGGKTDNTTTYFQYQNVNKYIVMQKYQLLTDGLVPNLKAMISGNTRMDYIVTGNELKLIESYSSDDETYADTTHIIYDGKYPLSITSSDNEVITDFVWAANGMYRQYTKLLENETYSNETKYYFNPNDQYLMLDSMVQTYTQGSFTRTDYDRYSYNEKYDKTFSSNYMGEYQYINYVYDAHDNWTSREIQYRPINMLNWTTTSIETRTISYY